MTRRVQIAFTFRTWGGARRGAGRPPTPGRRRVPHRSRPLHDRHCPVHVTLRAAVGVPSLRGARVFGALRAALDASSAAGFRVVQFSAQRDHVHLVVEADAPSRFVRGVQGLMIRVAKAVNRAGGRHGRVWGGTGTTPACSRRRGRSARRWCTCSKTSRNTSPACAGRIRARPRRGSSAGAHPRHHRPGPRRSESHALWLARMGWLRLGRLRVDEAPRGAVIAGRSAAVDTTDPHELGRAESMKKAPGKKGSIPPETSLERYDWSKARRGRYASRFPRDTHAVVIAPELWKHFGDAGAVNDALRRLVEAATKARRVKRPPNRRERRGRAA